MGIVYCVSIRVHVCFCVQDLFTPSVFCSLFEFAQIFFFEALTYVILSQFGTGWLPYLLACVTCGAAMVSFSCKVFGYVALICVMTSFRASAMSRSTCT